MNRTLRRGLRTLAVGILLAQELGSIYLWTIPVLSILSELAMVIGLNWSLRRRLANA